jgi:hypothetical protein
MNTYLTGIAYCFDVIKEFFKLAMKEDCIISDKRGMILHKRQFMACMRELPCGRDRGLNL